MMSSERKADVNNFLGTCMDLVFGVINPVKKCLNATIYKCFRTEPFLRIFSLGGRGHFLKRDLSVR
jgi:hypothetical protein